MGDEKKEKELSGEVIQIIENPESTVKKIRTKDNKEQAFEFPTAEQLDKDANSSDQAKAEKAKKLKRFEKRFDDALNHGLKIAVYFAEPIPAPISIPAENINQVIVSPK